MKIRTKAVVGVVAGILLFGACSDDKPKKIISTTTTNENSCLTDWHPPCKRIPKPGDPDFIGPIQGPDPRFPSTTVQRCDDIRSHSGNLMRCE